MLRILIACVVATTALAGSAVAAPYPSKPVTVVVPFTAGGASDTLTRIVANAMSKPLGQKVIVQNIDGAGGTLGSMQVAKAAPDGYTILIHHIGMSTAPSLYANLPFDPLTDFEPIGLVAEAPMTIVGRKDLPPDTLQELVAYLKDKNDTATYAFAGPGSATHLCGLLFMHLTGTKPTMVPYKGSGPALADVMGRHVDFVCDLTTGTTGQIQSGDFKAYALTAARRLSSIPNVPTSDEAGLKGFYISAWYGLYAPKGTPAPIIETLSKALEAALRDPHMSEQLAKIETTAFPPELANPTKLREQLASQIELWRPVLKSAGVVAK